jgi:hypothetical protein
MARRIGRPASVGEPLGSGPPDRGDDVFGRSQNHLTPLERALEAASGLKPGSWESVEALSMLSVECAGRPEARSLYESALTASQGLQSGSWASVRSLAWLVRAERALAGDAEV